MPLVDYDVSSDEEESTPISKPKTTAEIEEYVVIEEEVIQKPNSTNIAVDDEENLDNITFKSEFKDNKASSRFGNFSLFSILPPPSKRSRETDEQDSTTNQPVKKPTTFTVPVTLKRPKHIDEDPDIEDDADETVNVKRNRSHQKSGGLSFLPAPKRDITQTIENEQKNTTNPPTLSKTAVPLPKDFFDDGDADDTTSTTKTIPPLFAKKTSEPSNPIPKKINSSKRVPLSFKYQTVNNQNETEESEHNNNNNSIEEEEEENNEQGPTAPYPPPGYNNQHYEESSVTGAYPGVEYPQQQQQPAANTAAYEAFYQQQQQSQMQFNNMKVPKQFQHISDANIIEARVENARQPFTRYTETDAWSSSFNSQIPSGIDAITGGANSRNQKRQNHATYLLQQLKSKLPELEAKRADGARARKEARQKYGW